MREAAARALTGQPPPSPDELALRRADERKAATAREERERREAEIDRRERRAAEASRLRMVAPRLRATREAEDAARAQAKAKAREKAMDACVSLSAFLDGNGTTGDLAKAGAAVASAMTLLSRTGRGRADRWRFGIEDDR